MAIFWGAQICEENTNMSQILATKFATGKIEFRHVPAMTEVKRLSCPFKFYATSRVSTYTTLSFWPLPSHCPIDLNLSYISYSNPFIRGAICCPDYVNEAGKILTLRLHSPMVCTEHGRREGEMSSSQWPGLVSPTSESKKPTTVEIGRKNSCHAPLRIHN